MIWWLGNDYLLGSATLFIVLLNFYCYGVQECINTFTNATGMFWETRYKPIAECIINLGVSIFLASKIGILGVFIGTLVSYVCSFWINPVVIYKKQFGKNVIIYFMRYALYLIIACATSLGLEWLCSQLMPKPDLITIILRGLICVIVPNIFFCAIFFKTKEFRYCTGLVKSIINRKR